MIMASSGQITSKTGHDHGIALPFPIALVAAAVTAAVALAMACTPGGRAGGTPDRG
jgi:hypothetical protein